jgi:competence protein ComEA
MRGWCFIERIERAVVRVTHLLGGLMIAGSLAGCSSTAQSGVTLATPVASRSAAPAPTAVLEIKVYVTGEVARPGVYALAADSRVEDAVAAAGGFVAGADMPRVNLAARVRDEEEIFVPKVGEATPSLTAKSVNVNTASATQLRDGLSIPSSLASRIVSYRRQHGPFHSVEDLRQVPVPEDQLSRIRSQITAG